jgi:hypothetical protein
LSTILHIYYLLVNNLYSTHRIRTILIRDFTF